MLKLYVVLSEIYDIFLKQYIKYLNFYTKYISLKHNLIITLLFRNV